MLQITPYHDVSNGNKIIAWIVEWVSDKIYHQETGRNLTFNSSSYAVFENHPMVAGRLCSVCADSVTRRTGKFRLHSSTKCACESQKRS